MEREKKKGVRETGVGGRERGRETVKRECDSEHDALGMTDTVKSGRDGKYTALGTRSTAKRGRDSNHTSFRRRLLRGCGAR